MNRSKTDRGSPHTNAADYNEGSAAAERFKNAINHLASLPPGSVPRPQPQKKQGKKK